MKRLFDFDPVTGTTQWFHYDESEDSFTIETQQNIDALIEQNKDQFNSFSSGKDRWGDAIGQSTHVARIDLNTYMDLQRKGILRDPVAMKRWLNDPDNAVFRTRPGRV